ncbi:N-acetylglucosamine kinase [bacterium]|nr:N-acetylglucosamine kinase [bacterium]
MSYILIADSGSTKTDWRFINSKSNEVSQIVTKGLNPFHHTTESILLELEQNLLPQLKGKIDSIFFYGAGCSSASKKEEMMLIFKEVFGEVYIEIGHDLLAAARSTLNKTSGMVAILGTGSSAGFYNGTDVDMPIPSLGYVLGDEGSGVSIGKRILKSYLYKEMPEELLNRFQKRYLLTQEMILDGIYRKPLPNRFIASFSQFAFQNRENPFVVKLLKENFTELFESIIVKIPDYKNYPLALVGSVAFYYSDIIKEVATEFEVNISMVLEKPIAGLTLYHHRLEN